MDDEKVKVIFRMFHGEVLALFPEIPSSAVTYIDCLCYAHIGQHSGAHILAVIENSKPATETEYAALKRELESIGYDLDIRQRYTFKMYMNRKRNWLRMETK